MVSYNTQKFSQIMLTHTLKHDLYSLRPSIVEKIKATWNLSFSDIVAYLIDFYKNNSESEKLPTIVIPGPRPVVSLGNIILSGREVINSW